YAQVFWPSTFDSRLYKATPSFTDEVQRLHNHALISRRCHLRPPRSGLLATRWIIQINLPKGSCEQQLRVGGAETRQGFHVPGVLFGHMHLALAGQQVEGRELQVANGRHRPAIVTIGIPVPGQSLKTGVRVRKKILDAIDAIVGLLQYLLRGAESMHT